MHWAGQKRNLLEAKKLIGREEEEDENQEQEDSKTNGLAKKNQNVQRLFEHEFIQQRIYWVYRASCTQVACKRLFSKLRYVLTALEAHNVGGEGVVKWNEAKNENIINLLAAKSQLLTDIIDLVS